MEANARRQASWSGEAAAAAGPARADGGAGHRHARHHRADRQARGAARPGPHHPGGVRGEEGRAARTDVSAVTRPSPRVVSLVPSATETLHRARCRARRVHPVLRAAGPPARRRHEGSPRRRDRRARAGPRRGERRGEPDRGLRRAARRRVSTCTRCHRRASATSDRRSRAGRADRRRRARAVRRVGVARARPPVDDRVPGSRRRADLAAAVDDDEQPDVRLVAAVDARMEERGRRASRTGTRRGASSRWRGSHPSSCCSRTSRIRSRTGTWPRSRPRCPTARVALVDGQDLFWWGIRTPAALDRLSRTEW